MSFLDRKIENLKSPDGGNLWMTPEQEKALRQEMADYAFSACIDSAVRKEAEIICTEFAEAEENEEVDEEVEGD